MTVALVPKACVLYGLKVRQIEYIDPARSTRKRQAARLAAAPASLDSIAERPPQPQGNGESEMG